MIEIEKIGQEDYRYHFPTIDFKFHNTGSATAFLWKFSISVLEAEIDQKPVLEFGFTVINGALVIKATNNGWGAAHQCEILIDDPVLNQILADSTRNYRGNIQSGQEEIVFNLIRNLISSEKLKTLRNQFVRIDELHARWKCKDKLGKTIEGIEYIHSPGEGDLLITDDGFIFDRHDVLYAPAESHVTYCSIIDPSKYPHEYTYPISRKIPPGDVERFHILLGSPKSCRFRLRFKFFVDKENIIESEEFDIKIWNPRDSAWQYEYKDGAELNRRMDFSFPFIGHEVVCPRCGKKTEGELKICLFCRYNLMLK